MSIKNPVYVKLGNKKDSITYPRLFDGSINNILDSKEAYYDDIIRMNTSDRNKAKSTIAILNKLYYLANTTFQLLYSVFEDSLSDITNGKRTEIISRVTDMFDEYSSVVYEKGIVVTSVHTIPEFVDYFVDLYRGLLGATISVNNIVYDLSNVVDIIVHGEINSSLLYKEAYPYSNSKLVTQYINHLETVNHELRTRPVTYLESFMSYDDTVNISPKVVDN